MLDSEQMNSDPVHSSLLQEHQLTFIYYVRVGRNDQCAILPNIDNIYTAAAFLSPPIEHRK